MKLGYHTLNTTEDLPIQSLAVYLEHRGFESLWVGEHTHIPSARRTPYPGNGPLPAQYARMMDPLVSLAAAAASTRTLLLGTCVLLPLQRDHFVLAKEIATLDHLSGGRLLVGLGVGWNEEEYANHTTTPWRERHAAFVEMVQVLKALWTETEASYAGDHFAFDAVWSEPKPLQRPHPPVLMGFTGAMGRKIAAAWADGWMPLDFRLRSAERRIEVFRTELAEAGRDPTEVEITIVAGGDPKPDLIRRLEDVGVSRVVLGVERDGWFDKTTTLRFLDSYAAVAER